MVDFFVRLGNFTFKDFEVPEIIPFGGSQITAAQTLIGGIKIVQATGPSENDIVFDGLMQGYDAGTRANILDGMRIVGKKIPFVFSRFRRTVMIKSFEAKFERFYRIKYHLVLEVIENTQATQNAKLAQGNTLNNLLGSSVFSALGLSSSIGDLDLSSSLTQLNSILSVVGSATGSSAINGIANYVATAQSNSGLLASVLSGNMGAGILAVASATGGQAAQGISLLTGLVTTSQNLADTNNVSNILNSSAKELNF